VARHFREALSDLPERLASKKAKSWFERYRLLFLDDMGIDWHKGPVKLDDLDVICAVLDCPVEQILIREPDTVPDPASRPERQAAVNTSTASAVTPRRRDGRSLPPPE